MSAIDAAISDIATRRGEIGAFQKHTVNSSLNNIGVAIENIAAANSVIADTDFAAESTNLIRAQLLDLTSLKALGIANSSSRSVLALLG